MEAKFLEQRIIKLWQLYKMEGSPVGHTKQPEKVKYAVRQLTKFAEEKKILPLLLINIFAYYYVYVAREKTFNKMFLRVSEFLDMIVLPKVEITSEDIDLAYTIEEDWNTMHHSVTNDFPFSLKTVLLRSNIKIMKNTFFNHSHDFLSFATIANFVRNNRRNYPQIHSMKEFFIHLPIASRKPGKYFIWQYTDPVKTLEEYYKKMYGYTVTEERFAKFASLLSGNDTLSSYKNVWGVKEMGSAV